MYWTVNDMEQMDIFDILDAEEVETGELAIGKRVRIVDEKLLPHYAPPLGYRENVTATVVSEFYGSYSILLDEEYRKPYTTPISVPLMKTEFVDQQAAVEVITKG